ncbi:hypothetical protein ACIQ9E_02090 [Streptomyces sp. NPDC094448]|uniref:hypothetical protein n=1 Tax=Streptomyces sp. NPDC094448 TaxID=3366063 RepID=UPI00381D86C7
MRIRSFRIAVLALMSVLLTVVAAPPAAAAPGVCSGQGNHEVRVPGRTSSPSAPSSPSSECRPG